MRVLLWITGYSKLHKQWSNICKNKTHACSTVEIEGVMDSTFAFPGLNNCVPRAQQKRGHDHDPVRLVTELTVESVRLCMGSQVSRPNRKLVIPPRMLYVKNRSLKDQGVPLTLQPPRRTKQNKKTNTGAPDNTCKPRKESFNSRLT